MYNYVEKVGISTLEFRGFDDKLSRTEGWL
jgi:hypothetical protein